MITVDEIMKTETHTLPATATVADAWVPRSALLHCEIGRLEGPRGFEDLINGCHHGCH